MLNFLGTGVDAVHQECCLGTPYPGAPSSIKDETDIWLDRSKVQKTNQTGSLSDLKTGLRVEVKYKEPARSASVTAE